MKNFNNKKGFFYENIFDEELDFIFKDYKSDFTKFKSVSVK